jgi:DNA-binding HxlR family transcriptional regulator
MLKNYLYLVAFCNQIQMYIKLVAKCNWYKYFFMENFRSHCPINLAVEVFGDKWSLLIIRDIMFNGKRHFRELLQTEEKIASNILTDRLAMLEREGIVSKTPDPDHKQKFVYRLTSKGIDLLPILVEIGAWSLKYKPVDKKQYPHAELMVKGGATLQKKVKKDLAKQHLV